ncbi:MAG: VCBS repeat-containing protein [candidate division Zixibacteria bacterium]|nr:VCBS repeat-containing protein [candidate division Zixibacteria bacterium]
MKKKRLMIAGSLLLFFVPTVWGAIHMSTSYVWFAGNGTWPGGVAWADIDGNSWPDLVTAVGIDAYYGNDAVYFGDGTGLSTTPGWVADYAGASAMIYLGDLDNDGTQDLVVPSTGVYTTSIQQPQVVYFNDDGLPPTPDWSSMPINSWSCVVGDPDGDGDLDLVFGDNTGTVNRTVKMFINQGGSFNMTPDWQSAGTFHSLDEAFADVNGDGYLDLAITGEGTGVRIFMNNNGTLETTPSWGTDAITGGPALAFGDIDDDGDPDLAVAGGWANDLSVFLNNGGVLDSTPFWRSTAIGRPSGVAWGDADGDNDLDLAISVWQGPAAVFENIGGTLEATPSWYHSPGGSPQSVAWGDFDRDKVIDTVVTFTGDGLRKLFQLKQKALLAVADVLVDDVSLDLTTYCYDLVEGYVSMATAPDAGSTIEVHYSFSRDLDLAIGSYTAHVYENYADLYLQPFYEIDSMVFVDDDEDGFHDPGETVRGFFYLANIGAADTNVTITVTANDPDVMFTSSTAFFAEIDGGGTVVNNLGQPIEYIVPDIDVARFDTFYVEIESDLGVYRDIFTIEQAVGHIRILLVDDDRGATHEELYGEDLHYFGIPCHIWDGAAKGDATGEELLKYHKVFWFTGDSTDDYLQTADIDAMKAFLDGGGNLFLTGQGLAGELHDEDSAFLDDYLHCRMVEQYFYFAHDGIAGSAIGNGLKIRYYSGVAQSVYEPHRLEPTAGGQPEFKFNRTADYYSAVSYAGDYKTVFFSWGYEALSNQFASYNTRYDVLERILNFFREYMCGDANADEAVNLLDILYVIDYLYGSPAGPAPNPLDAGDANADGAVNLLDILYVIDYLYGSPPGPEPLCP